MSDYYDLIEQIRKKPGLYIGSPSISSLYMFLQGYRFARHQLNVPLLEEERQFQEFQPWLQEKFAIRSSHSWCQLLLLHSVDERDAFERFFRLFQEFLQQYPHSVSVNRIPEVLAPSMG